ncbi:MAG: SET domain-containing protein-lysine N-methyltransferase [archaeon]|nr:SET domain-containing protein-lysine N-methyltransferase [archaeon]
MKKRSTSPYIVVRDSKIHGHGVFAKKDIPKNTQIIEYVGERITKKEAERRADIQYEIGEKGTQGHVYLFEINKRYDIDGNVPWNTAKSINHSCDPNCEAEDDKGRIWILSKRDIKKGEELTYNYGYDFENYKEHPCRCGSPKCIRYIIKEKDRNKLKKLLEKKKK